MWVIFFQGTPHFWLIGGAAYRVGKKDCHVVIQDDRSISRTHLTVTVGLQPATSSAPSTSSSPPPSSSRTGASLGGHTSHHPLHPHGQPHHAEDADGGAPQPITLLDSSTYGTSVAACGSTEADDAETSDDSGGAGGVAPALEATGVLGLSYAPAARKRQRSRGSASGASAAPPAAPPPALQLTKEVPYHVPVHRRAWQAFTVHLGHHGATLQFVWVDVAVLCEDVEVEMQMKLTHALRCCGVRQVAVPGGAADGEAGEEAITATHVSNSAPADGTGGSARHGGRGVAPSHPTSTLTVLGGSGLSLTQRPVSETGAQTVAGTPITAPPATSTASQPSSGRAAVASPASSPSSGAPQRCYNAVSFLVTSTVQPSTAVVAMLCRAVPIVSPAFFLTIRDRASPQMPLPDPGDFLPPLAPWWREMLTHAALPPPSAAAASLTATSSPASAATSTSKAAADTAQAQQRRCFAPQPARRALFRGLTFLLIQRPLYDEVVSYLDGAGAELVWADVAASGLGGLAAWVGAGRGGVVGDVDGDAPAARDAMAALQTFFARHHRCVLLYSETELEVPWTGAAVAALRHGLGLCAVEYAQLVESIVSAQPLALPPYPTRDTMPQTLAELVARVAEAEGCTGDGGDDAVDADRTQDDAPQEEEEGRRTDAQPLFPDLGRIAAAGDGVAVPPACGGGDSGAASAARAHRRPRKENADGWVTFEAATGRAAGAVGAHAVSSSTANATSTRTAELHFGPLPLPPYPCFADVTPTDGTTAIAEGGKLFVKQALPPSEPRAELEQHRARQQLSASMLTARVPTVDAEGVVPEQVVMGGGRGGLAGRVAAAELASGIAFNAFDTAAHHAANRRRGTAARRGGRGASRAARSRGGAIARVDGHVEAAAQDAAADAVGGRMGDAPAAPPRATPPTASADSTFHIFDIDGIF